MIRKAMASLVSLCLVLAGAAAIPAPAADGGEQAQEKAKKPSNAPAKVYTNEDLKRLSAKGPGREETTLPPGPASAQATEGDAKPEPPSGEEEEADPLDQLFAREAARKEHAKQVAQAEERVAAAKQQVADLEKRLLAIKNPFLARPKAPEDEEAAAAWEGGGGPERVEQTQGQLEAARAEVAQAERDLAELRLARP
jgi:hypothetical protein